MHENSLEAFNLAIDPWIESLEQYSFSRLCTKPPGGWSIGQLYKHLVADTGFYIEQVKRCLNSKDHITEQASLTAQTMFLNNAFPDMIIEGAPSNAYIASRKIKSSW